MKIIKFSTPWCGPCKTLTRLLNEEVDLNGVELVEVDAEADVEMAEKYNIRSVPVLVFEIDGKEVDRVVGIVPPELIEEKIKAE